ncbi:hypothetical protein [Kibdelosporangium phytohabitans]|nr:hypothetical protein [Kibdelosporangium phytohabitans]MBE1469125.1 hypothetical protein [Kibdelosporangium phytohabitans]
MRRRLSALLAACVPLLAVAAPASAHSAQFTAYDNHNYAGVALKLVDVNLIRQIEHPGWLELTSAGNLPPESEFRTVARRAAERSPGPIVLDFENIWLRDDNRQPPVERRVAIWTKLLTWARAEARPGQIVGAYKFLNEVDLRFEQQAKDLARLESAFFPQLYTGTDYTHGTWTARLRARIGKARRIDPAKPVIAYIWPQYETGQPGAWVPGDRWRAQLDALLREGTNGFVIWGPVRNPPPDAASQPWVAQTRQFLDAL